MAKAIRYSRNMSKAQFIRLHNSEQKAAWERYSNALSAYNDETRRSPASRRVRPIDLALETELRHQFDQVKEETDAVVLLWNKRAKSFTRRFTVATKWFSTTPGIEAVFGEKLLSGSGTPILY